MGIHKQIFAAALALSQLPQDQDTAAPLIRLRNISLGDARANAKAKRKIRLAQEMAEYAEMNRLRRKAQNTKHFLKMTHEEQKEFKKKHEG